VGWWYQRRAVDGSYPALDLPSLARGHAGLLPMVYGGIGGSAADLQAKAADSLAAAPTLIGVGAVEYASWAALRTAIEDCDEELAAASAYRGIVVYESAALQALPGW
jgi:hypothetical protein